MDYLDQCLHNSVQIGGKVVQNTNNGRLPEPIFIFHLNIHLVDCEIHANNGSLEPDSRREANKAVTGTGDEGLSQPGNSTAILLQMNEHFRLGDSSLPTYVGAASHHYPKASSPSPPRQLVWKHKRFASHLLAITPSGTTYRIPPHDKFLRSL